MQQILFLNPENATEEEANGFTIRKAARAVVIDKDDNVALLHVSKNNYYKLPGGGLEDGEDKVTALRRECQEEIGCDVSVIAELGEILEYRKKFQIKQTSYCYLARVKGRIGTPKLTDHEISRGFKQVWMPYKEALEFAEKSESISFTGKLFVVPRDIRLLKEAGKIYTFK